MDQPRRAPWLRQAYAVALWLLLSGLLLVLFVQLYELTRTASHWLIPANFEQEVASRARPMLISNSVLVLGAVGWIGAVVLTMGRLLDLGRNPDSDLKRFCTRWFGTAAGLLALLWLADRWLPLTS